MGTKLTIKNRQLAEEILIFEFSDAPENIDIQDEVRSEIQRMVNEINLGATRTWSEYLNIEVEIES